MINLAGQLKSGKNQMQIGRNGRHYPLPAWAAWRDEAVFLSRTQWKKLGFGELILPVELRIDYWAGDKRRRDVAGMLDALGHVFERAEILKDDSLIKYVSWRSFYDPKNPRTWIEIKPLAFSL